MTNNSFLCPQKMKTLIKLGFCYSGYKYSWYPIRWHISEYKNDISYSLVEENHENEFNSYYIPTFNSDELKNRLPNSIYYNGIEYFLDISDKCLKYIDNNNTTFNHIIGLSSKSKNNIDMCYDIWLKLLTLKNDKIISF